MITVAIGADHAGFQEKDLIVQFLRDTLHVTVVDCGTNSSERVDYPDIAATVGHVVTEHKAQMGILICGTGIGMCISANKIEGVRCALCHDHYTARMARLHNDANVLAVGARTTGMEVIKEIVETFLKEVHAGGHHADRVAKISALESKKPS